MTFSSTMRCACLEFRIHKRREILHGSHPGAEIPFRQVMEPRQVTDSGCTAFLKTSVLFDEVAHEKYPVLRCVGRYLIAGICYESWTLALEVQPA